MKTIVGRISEIAASEDITITALEKKIGASKGVLSRAIAKNTDIQSKWLTSIVENYPQYNADWLLTGRPPKTKERSTEIVYRRNGKIRNQVVQQIPLYGIEATAGIIDLLHDHSQQHIPIDYITIPNLPKCDGAIPITGDSMYPLLKSGDIVLYKEVQDKSNIIWGEMYLVAISHRGDDFFFAKYIQKSEREGWVRLVSQNQHHASKDFPIDSIRALALIKASIRFNTAF